MTNQPVKIAFINPPKTHRAISTAAPPINLGYLAGYALKTFPNLEITIIDGMAGQDIFKKLEEIKPNIVGLTSTTLTIKDAYEIADRIKKEYPSILIVFGGVHASAKPEEALNHADIVIQGEGETALKKIIEDYSNDSEKIKREKRIIKGEYFKDINLLPSPAWPLLDMEFYIGASDNTAKTIPYAPAATRALTLTFSRGCPYRCAFCYNSSRQTPVRYFRAERVIEELLKLINNYKVNTFFFADDEMIINLPRLEEILNLFEKYNFKEKITWGCQARSDAIIRAGSGVLKRMKENGCTLISIGVESGSQKVLDILKKQESPDQHQTAFKLCRLAGLKVSGSFMFGTPGETREDMIKTWQFIKANLEYLELVGIGVTTPYPGTELWEIAVKKNLLPENIDYRKLCPDADMGLDDDRLVIDTMPKAEFKHLFLTIKMQLKELEMNRGRLSGKKIIKLFFKHPLIGFKYILSHPSKTIFMIKKIITGQVKRKR